MIIAVNTGKPANEFNEELSELIKLCEACEIEVLDTLTQNLSRINPNTYIGSGKVQEMKLLLESEQCGIVVVNDELSPLQVSNLEKELGVDVFDRTYIILEIFSRRARTKEAKLQVQLASNIYQLPRLVGAHKHLSRQEEPDRVLCMDVGAEK